MPTTDGFFAFDINSGEEQWNADYPGRSAPTIADGTVYVTANTTDELSLYDGENELLALDAADGSVQWQFEISVPETQSGYTVPGISVTPAVAEGRTTSRSAVASPEFTTPSDAREVYFKNDRRVGSIHSSFASMGSATILRGCNNISFL